MTSLTGNQGMQGPSGQGNKIPKGYKMGQIQNYTPEQMKLLSQMMGHVGEDSYLSRLAGGDQSMFDEMEAPALRQFSQMQGNIASRFSGGGGAGSLSNRNSSAFQNTSNQASSNFAQELQSRRQSLQQQALKDLAGISSDLLDKRPYENFMYEKPQKQNTALGLAGTIAGGAGGFLMGGPMGAMTGAKMGWDLGSGGTTNQGFQSSGNEDWVMKAANYFDKGI